MKPKIILFEGLDGVGKTTLINSLLEEKGGILVPVKGKLMNLVKKTYNFFGKNPPLITHIINHKLVENKVKKITKEKLIILDRNILTTIAYYSVLSKKDLSYLIKNMNILPDLIFYISVNSDKRKKRIKQRGEKLIDKLYFERGKLIDKKYREILKNFPNVVFINNSSKNPKDCYKIIKKEVEKI